MASFLLVQKALSAPAQPKTPIAKPRQSGEQEYKAALKKEVAARTAGFKAVAAAEKRGAGPEKLGQAFYKAYNSVKFPEEKGAIEGFFFKDKDGGILSASDIGKSLMTAILDGGIGYLFKVGLSGIDAADKLDLTPPHETKMEKKQRLATISRNRQNIKSADIKMQKVATTSAKKESKKSFIKQPKMQFISQNERKK